MTTLRCAIESLPSDNATAQKGSSNEKLLLNSVASVGRVQIVDSVNSITTRV